MSLLPTPEEIAEATAAIAVFDANRSGRLDYRELHALFNIPRGRRRAELPAARDSA